MNHPDEDFLAEAPTPGACLWDQRGGITAITEAHNVVYRRSALRYMLWATLGLNMDEVPESLLAPVIESLEEIRLAQIVTQKLAKQTDLPLNSWHPMGNGPIVLLGYRLKLRTSLYDLDDVLELGDDR